MNFLEWPKCQTPSKTQTEGRTDEETRLFVRPFVSLSVDYQENH